MPISKYKTDWIVIIFLFVPACVFPQTQTIRNSLAAPALNSGNEFDIYQKSGGGGIDAFKTGGYGGDVKGNPFFLTDWSKGEVVTVRKEVYGDDLQFVYDKVRQELFVRRKDEKPILLANKDEIQSFSLSDENGNHYNFINSRYFTDVRPEVFYQVLVYDSSKLSLFKYIKTSFVRGDPNDMMKQKEGAVNDEFVDKNIYFLEMGKGELKTIQLKSKSINKVLVDLHINAEAYMSAHPEQLDEKYLVELIKSLNH
jgi:hypothetical protein